MAEKRQLEFFLLRYVPDAVREEFVNIGVVMVEAWGERVGVCRCAVREGLAAGAMLWIRRRMWKCLRRWSGRFEQEVGEVRDRAMLSKENGGFVFECDSAFATDAGFGGRTCGGRN